MSDLRFHFIYPKGEKHQGQELAPSDEWPLFYGAPAAWTLQGYYRLKDHLPGSVTIGSTPEPDSLNVSDSGTLRRLRKDHDLTKYFLVNCLTDKPDYIGADFRIVQNKTQVRSPKDLWMPLWPQPGLIPRARDRGERMIIGFFGRPRYGLASLLRGNLIREIETLGYVYREIPPDEWHDYYDVDVAVGIRSFNEHAFDHKPPSKLVNAWHAGVPFIGGADSAYTQLGTPGYDFLRATSKQTLLESLEALKNPDFYHQLIRHGGGMASKFSIDDNRQRWVQSLVNRITPMFLQWKASGRPRSSRISEAKVRTQIFRTRLGRRFGWF